MKRDSENELIEIKKEERKGIWTLLIIFFISWGMMMSPYGAMRLVAWLALGLTGFSLWKIIDKLLNERIKEEGGSK